MQGLLCNSMAMTLLTGFDRGNIQMQENAIKHLHEGNMAKLQSVTIELLEPEMGRIMGSILDVNFDDGMNQMTTEEYIREMLSELGSENPMSNEQNSEINLDNHCYSMGKEKQGKPNQIPLPATKEADKKKRKDKEKQKGKDKGKDKPKPPLRSGLGPAASTTALLATTGPTMRHSPA